MRLTSQSMLGAKRVKFCFALPRGLAQRSEEAVFFSQQCARLTLKLSVCLARPIYDLRDVATAQVLTENIESQSSPVNVVLPCLLHALDYAGLWS
ncbi:hypothetical protein AU476_12740 [Cupriavidus sp. UYMSc13B]|nr:hypothetical protein AU476_12740 [Cupriavidus sp. UYMSc13B]